MGTFMWRLYFISIFWVLVSSQNVSVPLAYFCTRLGHSTTKIGDAIYAYGGVRSLQHFNSTYTYDRLLIKVDVSYSWDLALNNQPATFVSSPNALNGPPSSLIDSGIFNDADSNFRIYGGGLATSYTSAVPPITARPVQNDLWTLSNNNDSWSSTAATIPGLRYAPMHSLFVQAPEHDLVFYLNGILSNGSTQQRVYTNMIVLNTRTEDVRVVSTESISLSTSRVGAILQYLPRLGEKGGLILLGGATRHNDNITTDQWGTMVSLDTIHIFDIASLDNTPNGIWYHQRTNGRMPQPRITNCAIQIPSPDNTSYHIYISSGYSPSEIYDDIWVLSIPQFHWTQVFAGERPNYGSTCHLVGNKQMLLLGGFDRRMKICEVSTNVSLFDLTNLKWLRDFVKDDKEFRVPKAVWEWIGGSAMGEAKMREPEGGFSHPALARMFDGMSGEVERKSSGIGRKARSGYESAIVVAGVTGALLLW